VADFLLEKGDGCSIVLDGRAAKATQDCFTLSGLAMLTNSIPQAMPGADLSLPLRGVGAPMNSAAQDMCLIWLADVFRPEGAPTNQPQASPGEQAIIKPPSPERALQRDAGGTSLSFRRAWCSVGASTTPFTKLQGRAIQPPTWSTVSGTGFPKRPTTGKSVVSPKTEIIKGNTHIVSKTGTPPKT
jgi:hypothetical protein